MIITCCLLTFAYRLCWRCDPWCRWGARGWDRGCRRWRRTTPTESCLGGCSRIKDGFSSRSKKATCDVSEEDDHNLKEQIKSGQHSKEINCRLKCKIVENDINIKEMSLISRTFQGNFHCMLILSLALLLVFYQQRVDCCEEQAEIWETTLDNWKKNHMNKFDIHVAISRNRQCFPGWTIIN